METRNLRERKDDRVTRALAPWRDSLEKPAIYHCLSRVVDKRFVLKVEEKERFRSILRKTEAFSGCRVLAYCVMDNHFHILLEVPPMPEAGLSDEELVRRVGALYGEDSMEVFELRKALREARGEVAALEVEMNETDRVHEMNEADRVHGMDGMDGMDGTNGADEGAVAARVAAVHSAFTYRMHDLSEFMKTLMLRFTKWFNRTHEREGHLWERRFKSVIVDSVLAARLVAAYIDLNPVRAKVCADPADYRWSSYGEAVGAGSRGGGRLSREGLVRAFLAGEGVGFEESRWRTDVGRDYRELLALALQSRKGGAEVPEGGLSPEMATGAMLMRRLRYLTDGLAIGSRAFVDEVFAGCRSRFGRKRRTGARRLRGAAAPDLWSARDLRDSESKR